MKRVNTLKFFLQGHNYPDTKTRQRHYEKRKLQANISDEYSCKDPQQNISKLNSTVYKKDHTIINWDLFQGGTDSSVFANQLM